MATFGCGRCGSSVCNCSPWPFAATTAFTSFSPVYSTSSRLYRSTFEPPMSRRERKLRDLQEQFRSEHREIKHGRFKQKLEGRIAEQQREKQAMLDKRSRARSAPAATKRKDALRLQTYDAAMHERQMRR